MQSPESATAVATFDELPTQISVLVKDGSAPVVSDVQVPLPARKVVALGVPVTAVRLLVPMLVSAEPLPEKLPEKVPPVIVPESVGEAERTTDPVPVGAVVQEIAVPLVAAQKSLVVSVPKVTLPVTVPTNPLKVLVPLA